MKTSKEERALLSKIIQQEFTKVLLANRAEKVKGSPAQKEKTRGFRCALGFWRRTAGQKREQPIAIAKAASTSE